MCAQGVPPGRPGRMHAQVCWQAQAACTSASTHTAAVACLSPRAVAVKACQPLAAKSGMAASTAVPARLPASLEADAQLPGLPQSQPPALGQSAG